MISTLAGGTDSEYATQVSCLDDLVALAFVEGTMSPQRRTQALEHLDTCASCQELVAGVISMIKVADTALGRADTAPGAAAPVFPGYTLG